MAKNYGKNINLNLDSKKVNDLEKLVKLYTELENTKLRLNHVQNKTMPISINKEINSVKSWIEILTKSLKELQSHFSKVAGVSLSEGKLNLADASLNYVETEEGSRFKFNTIQNIENLLS